MHARAYFFFCSSTQVIGAIRELRKYYMHGLMQKKCSQRTNYHRLLASSWKIANENLNASI